MPDDSKKDIPVVEMTGWLTGQVLIAMPSMIDPRFERTVVLVCSHGPEGAMGIVINRMFGELSFHGLLEQLNVSVTPMTPDMSIHYGGPVDPVRGFVLHSNDYKRNGTVEITNTISMTATLEILEALSSGTGPEKVALALGYAGWSPGQLESEIQSNGWLTAPADEDIIFGPDLEDKWRKALAKIGVAPSMLASDSGHA